MSTTWNPSDKGANITLTESNLTAENTQGTWAMVRANISKSAGKWYWEIQTYYVTSSMAFGIATSAATLTDFVGQQTTSWGYLAYDGTIMNNNSIITTKDPWKGYGQIIGCALDCDNHTVKWYWNNTLESTQTIANTTWYPALACFQSQAYGKFAWNTITYTPPSGYSVFDVKPANFLQEEYWQSNPLNNY